MNQLQQFENFTGTEEYHKFNNKYVFTDGIEWLLNQIYPDNQQKQSMFLETCIYFNGFKYPFISVKLKFNKKKKQRLIEITDGDNHVLNSITADFELNDGEYRIFVYNFCILAATEY